MKTILGGPEVGTGKIKGGRKERALHGDKALSVHVSGSRAGNGGERRTLFI